MPRGGSKKYLRDERAKESSHGVRYMWESGVRQRYVSRSYGKGASLLVIEGVPVMSCPHCGESYLTAQTLHEVDRIKREREGIATKRTVAVAAFA